ncbi:hypothetical protein IHE45_03G101500 [Dioscorea alata]|uniref:Uncharacterized protein n=1 Tax=Dioscorea alata TaxID=55571 RepID=A0ACB7WMG9_DIOAL|nr:hypothetical protein IHE45_03G101500 [Dioscorea alata]
MLQSRWDTMRCSSCEAKHAKQIIILGSNVEQNLFILWILSLKVVKFGDMPQKKSRKNVVKLSGDYMPLWLWCWNFHHQ